MTSSDERRFEERVLEWRVNVEEIVRTPRAILAIGRRGDAEVVLKVLRSPDNEWTSGEMLRAFGGCGTVRLLEDAGGAVLMERLVPGTALADEEMEDDVATRIIAGVIGQLSPGSAPALTSHAVQWCRDLDLVSLDGGIPGDLLEDARATSRDLLLTSTSEGLLHGDLHHENILRDARRGWVAIDPKGVIGEPAFEIGAAMRNPCGRPELFAAPDTIRSRLAIYARMLELQPWRILAWTFVQAILAAAWELEDEGALDIGTGWIALAASIRAMPEFIAGL